MMKRRSFVVVISDLFADVDDILAGLDHLRFDGHNVVVLHTLDPYELEFPFKGTWRFEGLEEEEPLTTQPERIREDYLASFNAYLEALRAGCVGSHVDYTTVDTSRPLDAVLSEFFFQRQATLQRPVGRSPIMSFLNPLLSVRGARGRACRSSRTCSTATRSSAPTGRRCSSSTAACASVRGRSRLRDILLLCLRCLRGPAVGAGFREAVS